MKKTNKKRFFKMFVACFVLIPCLFFLYACNDPRPLNYILTKEQYRTAFSAVSDSLNSSREENSTNKVSSTNVNMATKSLSVNTNNQVTSQAPVISGIEDLPNTLELGEIYKIYNVIVTDVDSKATDINLAWEVTGENSGDKTEWISIDENGRYVFDLQEIDIYTITLTATDESGNSSSQSFIVTVQDTSKPTIELSSEYPQSSYAEYSFSQIVVNEGNGEGKIDDNGNEIKWNQNRFPSVNLPDFTAKDKYEEIGFASLGAKGTLTIVTPDEIVYTIDDSGNGIEGNNEINLQLKNNSNGNYFTFTPTKRGHYIATYSATDLNGNSAEKDEIIDIYVGDTEVPVIYLTNNFIEKITKTFMLNYTDELVINSYARINGQANFNSQDIYVDDNFGFNTNISDNTSSYEYVIVSVSVVNENNATIRQHDYNNGIITYKFDTVGTYTVIFTVADKGGNTSTLSRNFVVEEDAEKPTINLTNNLLTKLNKTYVIGEDDELIINPNARLKGQTSYNAKDLYVEDNYGFGVRTGSINGSEYEYVPVSITVVDEANSVAVQQTSQQDETIKFKFITESTYKITFTVTDLCGNKGVIERNFLVISNSTQPENSTNPVQPAQPTTPSQPSSTPEESTPPNTTGNESKAEPLTAIQLLKFVSLIMQNPNYEVSNQTVAYNLHINQQNIEDSTIYIRQRLNYDGTYISGAIMTFETPDSPYHETIAFKINYNFDTNKLVSYEISDECVMSDETFYQSFILQQGTIYAFCGSSVDELDADALEITTRIHNTCELELQTTPVAKDYNFDEEYALAVLNENS